jgi:hypothetical protein
MIRKIPVSACLIIVSVLLASCGYHFSGEGDGPKPGLKYVAVPVFENKTSEHDLGALFAGALRREFMQKGRLQVVPVEEAEAVFKGTITSIYITPVAHHPAPNVVVNRVTVENRLYITLDIRCEDKKTHKVLWRDPAFKYFRVYRLSDDPLNPDPMVGYDNRRSALEYLAGETAIRIHDRFLSNF